LVALRVGLEVSELVGNDVESLAAQCLQPLHLVGGQLSTVLLHNIEEVVLLLLACLSQPHLLVALADAVLQVVAAECLHQVELEFERHETEEDWLAFLAVFADVNSPHLT